MYDEGYEEWLDDCAADEEAAYQAQCNGEAEALAQQEADAAEADRNELKPCPFCGSDDVVFEIWQPGVINVYQIHCIFCGFRSDHFGNKYGKDASSEKNKEIAIEAWNRRV